MKIPPKLICFLPGHFWNFHRYTGRTQYYDGIYVCSRCGKESLEWK